MGISHSPRSRGLALALAILAPLVLGACGSATGEAPAAAKTAAVVVAASPSAAAPAATAAPAAPPKVFLSLQVDTVRAGDNLTPEEKPFLDCVQSNRIPQNGGVEFRVKVWDPLTGKTIDDKGMKSVVVTMGNGDKLNLEYLPRPKTNPTDYFWRAHWVVPENFPTGSFPYKVDAVDSQGRTGSWAEFNIKPTQLQIVAKGQR